MPRPFKDLFSGHASEYARFRPRYPEELFGYLASLTPAREQALDCGTGNGQAAVALARHYDRVFATDPSERQLASAEQDPKVVYQVASAERAPLQDASCDMVTAAQAFHWFRQEEFFAEARRVLKPRGVLALWSYGLARFTPAVDSVVARLYKDILGDYWEKERVHVEQGYRDCPFPFEELACPSFEMRAEWSLEQLIGYLGTWSALQAYLRKHGANPLELVARDLHAAWGSAHLIPVRWELSLRVGRAS